MNNPVFVNLGLGVDSTAVLCGMSEKGIKPDLIIFADTGGEKPDTYQYLGILRDWCKASNFPDIVTTQYVPKKAGKRKAHCGNDLYKTLEEECLVKKELPAIAYGAKTCSIRWKKDPIENYIKQWHPAIKAWELGGKVITVLGFEYGEERRTQKKLPDKRFEFWYPLIEWKWDRLECIKAIARSGLPIPPKSACFFCPSSTKKEIVLLAEKNPDLLERALEIERQAKPYLTSIKGLGRRFSWEEFLESRRASIPNFDELWNEEPVHACECWDGGGTDVLYLQKNNEPKTRNKPGL